VSADTQLVASEDSGIRVDRWFRRHYPGLAHGPLEKLLRTGQVRVDGKRVKAGERLEAGQAVRIPPQVKNVSVEITQRAPATSLNKSDKKLIQDIVIYEDSSLFVLNKPSGLASQGGSGIKRHLDGLLEGLQGRRRQRPRLVHRLDRDTSGVILVARTVPAAAALSEKLRRRDARKIYWALTRGVPSPRQGTIRLHLAKQTGHGPGGRDERMVGVEADAEGAQDAVTHYAVMGTAGKEYAWVALKPITGRTHQLRAHLQAIGTPIVGDFKYGEADAKGKGELEDKLHLHARSLDIAHPEGGRLSVTAPLPPHMLHSWKLFGFDPNSEENAFAALERKGRKR
jgi:23S rRNA pseudouridine955/2504/2580 synthase